MKNYLDQFPLTAKAWLHLWDSKAPVFSVEMGGLGPTYEQCVQITAAEMMRWLIANNIDTATWTDKEKWQEQRDRMDDAVWKIQAVKDLQLSAAQFGAAISLATSFYKRGPREVMQDPTLKERLIQVSNSFPSIKS